MPSPCPSSDTPAGRMLTRPRALPDFWKAHRKVPCAPRFARFRNLYCVGGRARSLPSTTGHCAGSISAPEMSHVFLFHGATLPLPFIAPAPATLLCISDGPTFSVQRIFSGNCSGRFFEAQPDKEP